MSPGSGPSSPSHMENGHLQPPAQPPAKAQTAPQRGAAVNRANSGSSLRPISFWHRQTGSGPRKMKVVPGSTPPTPSSTDEARPTAPGSPRVNVLRRNDSSRSRGPPTDGHSFAGEVVPEERESQGRASRDTEQREHARAHSIEGRETWRQAEEYPAYPIPR